MLENLLFLHEHLGIVDGLLLSPEPKGRTCAGQFIWSWTINTKECRLVLSLNKARTTTRNIRLKQREHFSRVGELSSSSIGISLFAFKPEGLAGCEGILITSCGIFSQAATSASG